MIEAVCDEPVAFTFDPMLVEGRLMPLRDDPYGMFYRMTDATPVSYSLLP